VIWGTVFDKGEYMFNYFLRVCSVAFFPLCCLGGCTKKTDTPAQIPPATSVNMQAGEELFRQFCHNCHPDGGNVSDPDKTLHGSSLRKSHITQPEDIVRIMRNPKSRMIRFDTTAISDKDARAIAEFVLRAYK
jgi:cytochrome c6